MDLSRIELVKLAQAYGLHYSECFELASNLDCYAKVFGGYLLLDKLDIFADSWAKNVKTLYNIPDEQAKQYAYIATIISPDLKDRYNVHDDIEYLQEIIKTVLLGLMTVPKKDAILLLNENGFYLKSEVQGLSKEFVQKIIGQGNSGEQSASVAVETSGADNTPDSEALIPRELWAQQDLHDVVAGMRARCYPDDAIAYAIFTGCKLTNKNEIGKLLFPHSSYDKKTHERKIRNFLNNPTKKWKLE